MPTYLCWTADLLDLARASSDGSLTSNHASGIAHHQDADEWIRVVVPVYNGLFGILINKIGLAVLADLSWNSNVGVTNFIVNDWDEVNSSDLGDDGEGLWALPGLVNKFSTSIAGSASISS